MELLLDISMIMDEDNRWLLLGLGLLAVMYLVVRPWVRRKKDPLSRPPRMRLSQERSVEREMSNLLVELSEMARQITAQLDTRAAKLEALISEADERIAALKAASGNEGPGFGGEGSGEGHGVRRRDSDCRVQDSGRLGQQAVNGNGDPSAGSRSASQAPNDSDPSHVKVYELADQGRTAYEIAEALSRPSGEIELILALRSKS